MEIQLSNLVTSSQDVCYFAGCTFARLGVTSQHVRLIQLQRHLIGCVSHLEVDCVGEDHVKRRAWWDIHLDEALGDTRGPCIDHIHTVSLLRLCLHTPGGSRTTHAHFKVPLSTQARWRQPHHYHALQSEVLIYAVPGKPSAHQGPAAAASHHHVGSELIMQLQGYHRAPWHVGSCAQEHTLSPPAHTAADPWPVPGQLGPLSNNSHTKLTWKSSLTAAAYSGLMGQSLVQMLDATTNSQPLPACAFRALLKAAACCSSCCTSSAVAALGDTSPRRRDLSWCSRWYSSCSLLLVLPVCTQLQAAGVARMVDVQRPRVCFGSHIWQLLVCVWISSCSVRHRQWPWGVG